MGTEETLELIETCPWTSANPLRDAKFFKSNLSPIHRYVLKNDDVQQRRQKQRVELPASKQPFPTSQHQSLPSISDFVPVRDWSIYRCEWSVNLHLSGVMHPFRIAFLHDSRNLHFFRSAAEPPREIRLYSVALIPFARLNALLNVFKERYPTAAAISLTGRSV